MNVMQVVRLPFVSQEHERYVPDLLLNVAKMHLPIEVPFYGMFFQSVNRSIVLTNVSHYTQ